MLTEQEFHRAAERYLDMVYRIALNYFRHPQDAEDAARRPCCGCGGPTRTLQERTTCATSWCG
jgi:hypothetical protein